MVAAQARRLVRGADKASLATLMSDDGGPYASMVMIATDHPGFPLLLVSELAQHTRNIKASGRASILVDGTAGHQNPLTGPRLTLIGTIAVDDPPSVSVTT